MRAGVSLVVYSMCDLLAGIHFTGLIYSSTSALGMVTDRFGDYTWPPIHCSGQFTFMILSDGVLAKIKKDGDEQRAQLS